ncbi:hypothetical protein [uncultured Microbacterium sp.]|uniref:hypothetical protein n=1 Tax=uncultured Microbacterium sp. TaxID=191216 RepID=UPI0025FCFC8A|nr:hypothetical protein [uncultured Microbacterium sp.]
MVAPTRVGWTFGSNAGAATLTLSNPASSQVGDRVIAFVSHTGSGATLTNLQGWTLLSTLTYNTRRWHILERDYAESYPPLSLSTAEGMLWATIALRATNGHALAPTVLGATWRRVDNGGSINTTQAPSVTAPANALALAFFSETSTAAEVEAGAVLTGTDWVKWFWSKATAGDANPINFLAYREPAEGATGTPVVTYSSAAAAPINSNNGAGMQLVVAQSPAGPAATGNLDTVGIFQNSATSLSVGARQITSGAVVAVLRRGATEVARQAMAFTSGRGNTRFTGLDAGTGYSCTFEVDGVVQTDVQATGLTLRTGHASFTAVTGSCMATGSTHPVFDAIAAENADFWTVQGDAHYEDATTAVGWWAGMVAGLNAWRGITRKLVTRWTPDNHDTIRTTPLGGDARELPPIWKQIAGADGFATSDTVGQAWQNGRVLFIQADLRSARDNYATDPAPMKMLGIAQKAWFKNLLAGAEADPGIGMVIWFGNWIGLQQGSGRWGSYPDEYADLNGHIQDSAWLRSRLVMIGGDSHNLWADSGARSWPEAAFPGIPSLNMSGYNKASPAETFFIPDIANETLIASGVESDWGGYSRIVITDDGATLGFRWDAVRVDSSGTSDVMATWSKNVVDSGASGTAAQELPSLSGSALGTVTTPAFGGSVAAALPALWQSASGGSTVPAYSGAVAADLPPLASAVIGAAEAPIVIGVMGVELPALIAASAASSAPPAQAGSVTMALPALTASAAGSSAVPERVGALDAHLPALTAGSIGLVTAPGGVVGAIASILGSLTAAVAGTSDGDAPAAFPDRRTLTPIAVRHTLTASAHSRTLEEV